MSFWSTSTGEAIQATGMHESGGGPLEPIPAGTDLLAYIKEAKWDETRDEKIRHVVLRWDVMKPAQYEKRVIFQRLFITDLDTRASNPATRQDNAKKMLAAIDANCGGDLFTQDGPPSEIALQSLLNKPMTIRVGLIKPNSPSATPINFISMVNTKAAFANAAAPTPAPKSRVEDDEIPF